MSKYKIKFEQFQGFCKLDRYIIHMPEKSTLLKCTSQWFGVYSLSSAAVSTINFRTLSSPDNRNPGVFKQKLYINVLNSIIHDSQKVVTAQMAINR